MGGVNYDVVEIAMVSASNGFADKGVLPTSSVVPCRYGRLLTISSDKIASESVRRYGEWAQQELDLIGSLVLPGDWIVDGGAYIGTHTLAFSKFVGSSGRVVSFEPRREAFRLLQANVEEVNRLGNVRLLNCALGDFQGSLNLHPLASDEELANPGGQSITDMHDAATAYPVTVTTLDALDLERLDFLKLDVEGAEASVVAGARQTIARHDPFVFVELNTIGLGVEMLAAMRAYDGYQAFGSISAAFNPGNYNNSTENIFSDAVETVLLFAPKEKLDRVEALATSFRMTPVESVDEIALVLLHKPQYVSEILRDTAAGQRLGLDYPSPRARRLMREQAEAADAHAAALNGLARTHAMEDAARMRAYTDKIRSCQQAHAREIEVLRTAAEARLAAAMAASERAQREQADDLVRAYSKRVVALTTGHAEKLRAISCAAEEEVEAAHECVAQHERALGALYASRSWRFTAPLRHATTILRQALGRRTTPHLAAR
ncbi:MAG: FkbM family methyltransferase [Chloroflexota bacterium]